MVQNNTVSVIKKGHDLLVKILDYLRDPFLLIIRLYWGYGFYVAGRGKLLNLDRTAAFFTDIGIPAPKFHAIFVGSLECFGGWLLILGLASRLISIPLAFSMVVAFLTAHSEGLKELFTDPDKALAEAPFLFLYASVIIMTCGPGKLSLDSLISSKLFPKEETEDKK
ncbi:MAG: DoxX family protein [Acidobacteria bacterium]|nr:DoxX family protein [Acidobacteriota bacterium]